MNLELLNPFDSAYDFPEIIEECLENGFATTCAFNRKGTLLAVGASDGRCVIWDFDTKGVARVLTHGHARAVTSVSWSKDGRRLLSSANDWKIIMWDIVTGNKVVTLDLGTVVLFAQLLYRNGNYWCVACPLLSAPVLINLDKPDERFVLPTSEDGDAAGPSDSKSSKGGATAIAVFSKSGDRIYVGNSKGVVYIVDSSSREVISSFRVPGNAAIKSISFDKKGKFILLNSSDRVVRIFDAETYTCMREFQDYVNKMQWKKCCFSGNMDYVIGGSAQKQEHNIYIWNTYGQLVKILEGPKEGIMDLVWHPTRPVIASCSTSGVVYIWAKNYTENWSAFAPDFKELEENEEYEEKEDEFDVVPENDKAKKKLETEDELVDILEVERDPDASDDEDFLLSLPTRPERDAR